jgi:hypothetical protein
MPDWFGAANTSTLQDSGGDCNGKIGKVMSRKCDWQLPHETQRKKAPFRMPLAFAGAVGWRALWFIKAKATGVLEFAMIEIVAKVAASEGELIEDDLLLQISQVGIVNSG